MYSKIIDAYIKAHASSYQPKYCYHSCDRLTDTAFKFHYYVRDVQLLQIDIFLEIRLEDEVKVKLMENLHEQEQVALACDALNRIRGYTNRKTTISAELMPKFVANPELKATLTPQDMINILNHIEYHQGKNPDSIYSFYTLFLPYMEDRLKNGRYKEAMQACNLLFDEILYEVFWFGVNIKYLDQEHLMHQAYTRSVFNMLCDYFDEIYQKEPEALIHLFTQTFQFWRFAFSIYSSLENIALAHPAIMKSLLKKMDCRGLEDHTSGAYLVNQTLCAAIVKDDALYRESIKEVLKLLMDDMNSLANPEEQKQTGIIFLKMEGFDLLLEIFDETQDSNIYKCFPIADIPEDLHPYIKNQLETALKHYAKNLSEMDALKQITDINTLLIENF